MKIHERLFLGGKFLEGNWKNNSGKEKKQVVREERLHQLQYTNCTGLCVDFIHQLILWTLRPFNKY